jgi:hypothetical protein
MAGLALPMLVLAAPAAQAQSLGRLLACQDVARAEERLACYDQAARLAIGLGAVPAGKPPEADLAQRAAELDAREAKLTAREAALKKREVKSTVTAWAAPAASAADPEASAREAALAAREAALQEREAKVAAQMQGGNTADAFGAFKPPAHTDEWNRQQSEAGVKVERDSDGEVDAISAPVKEWQKSVTGQVILVLENGQVWRQTDAETVPLKEGDGAQNTVRISKGLLGSFLMTVNNSARSIKVRRIDGKKPKS